MGKTDGTKIICYTSFNHGSCCTREIPELDYVPNNHISI